jgi:hypothetical protein
MYLAKRFSLPLHFSSTSSLEEASRRTGRRKERWGKRERERGREGEEKRTREVDRRPSEMKMIDRNKFSAQRTGWYWGGIRKILAAVQAQYGNVIFIQGPCINDKNKDNGLWGSPRVSLRWGHHGGEHVACDPPAVRREKGHRSVYCSSRCVRAMRSHLRKLSSVGPASQQARTSSKLNGSTRSILAAGGGSSSEPGGGTIFPPANDPTVPTSRSIMSSGDPLNIAIPGRRETCRPPSRTLTKSRPRRRQTRPFFSYDLQTLVWQTG